MGLMEDICMVAECCRGSLSPYRIRSIEIGSQANSILGFRYRDFELPTVNLDRTYENRHKIQNEVSRNLNKLYVIRVTTGVGNSSFLFRLQVPVLLAFSYALYYNHLLLSN
jgi:hypothetical protein